MRRFLCFVMPLAASPAFATMQVPLDRADPGLATQQAPQVSKVPAERPTVVRPSLQAASAVEDRLAISNDALVRTIQVVGGFDIPPVTMEAAVEPFAGHRLSTDDMRDLLATVSGVARSKGYIFAHSTVPAQALDHGVLRIELDEGHIDEVRLIGFQNRSVLSVLNQLRGRAPTRTEVERQLMLAGDLPGVLISNVHYKRDGDRGILIATVAIDKITARAWMDNYGNNALGPFRTQVAVDLNGLLTGRDQLTISDLATPAQPRELNVASARYAYQLNNQGTEVAIFANYGRTRSGGIWRSFDSNGESVNAGVSIAQPLLRRRTVSLWLNGEIDYFAVDQWFAGERVRRDRLSTAALSANGYVAVFGGRLRLGLGVTQGLDIFGATSANDPFASRPDAGGRFTAVGAWSNWVGKLAGPLSARIAVTAQTSTRPLLAVEQITIGGPVFGRAYDFSERAGDRGILGSAELEAKLWDRSVGLIRWAQLYGFADGADVGNLRNDYGTGQLYSAGVGARARIGASIRVGIEAAFPINSDRFETGDKSPRLSASAETSF